MGEASCVNKARQLEPVLNALERAEDIGLDTESDAPLLTHRPKKKQMINVHRSTLAGLSLAVEGRAWYIPVGHRKHNLDLHAASVLFRAIEGSKARFWAHNAKHEVLAARRAPVPWDIEAVRNLGCTQSLTHLAQKALNQGRKNQSLRLKDLSKLHLGMEQLTFEEATGGRDFGQLDPRDPVAVKYACDDAVAALGLAKKLVPELLPGQEDLFWRTRGQTYRCFADMEATGFGLDVPRLEEHLADFKRRLAELEEEWSFLVGDVSMRSSQQLQALFERGMWDPKDLPRTAHGYSTEKEYIGWQLERCCAGSPGYEAARVKLEHGSLAKLVSTYGHKLVEKAYQHSDLRLHGSFNPTGTVTGRPSSSDPNLLNIPVRTEEGRKIRDAFVSREGWTLVSADYSQVELRILAHLLGEGRLYETFQAGGDAHQATADAAGVTRDVGKFLNFAIIYGVGLSKLAKVAGVSMGGAKRIMDTLHANEPGIAHLKERVVDVSRKRGYVRTLAGRHQLLPYLKSSNDDLRYSDERKAFNTPHQGGAADIMDAGMLAFFRRMDRSKCHLVCQVYDDLVCEMRDDYVEEGEALLRECLESAWDLRVPLVAEPARGKRWSAHK